MNGIENYIGFIIAAIVMNLTPGADTIYIITRSVAQGRKAGVYSVLGIGTGALVHIALAAFGLSVILMKSILLFTIIKWAGAAYLIYLGIKIFLDKADLFNNEDNSFEKVNLLKIYRQGFFTNLLNPKVAIFFISLLPQFIALEYVNNATPFLILGGTFLLTGTIWCLFLAYSASYMTKTLRNNPKIGKIMQKISGFVFVSLGLQLLINNPR
ncbi:MAG: homoserine lactone transporter [Kordia sp.]|nr:MAG: homoserine lactone transporter [Kordia sp.]